MVAESPATRRATERVIDDDRGRGGGLRPRPPLPPGSRARPTAPDAAAWRSLGSEDSPEGTAPDAHRATIPLCSNLQDHVERCGNPSSHASLRQCRRQGDVVMKRRPCRRSRPRPSGPGASPTRPHPGTAPRWAHECWPSSRRRPGAPAPRFAASRGAPKRANIVRPNVRGRRSCTGCRTPSVELVDARPIFTSTVGRVDVLRLVEDEGPGVCDSEQGDEGLRVAFARARASRPVVRHAFLRAWARACPGRGRPP